MLAFNFAAAYKKIRAKFIDPDAPVADLVRDFVVGYSVVRQNKKDALTRLLIEMMKRVDGEQPVGAAI